MTSPLPSPPLDPLEQAIAFAIQEAARVARRPSPAAPTIREAASAHAGTSDSVHVRQDEG